MEVEEIIENCWKERKEVSSRKDLEEALTETSIWIYPLSPQHMQGVQIICALGRAQ